MTAFICIGRPDKGYRDRYRSYEVIVNGSKRAVLWRGDSEKIEIDPGAVEVYVKIDWCKSRTLVLSLEPGSEARLRCRPRSALTALYGITFGRNSYIRLEDHSSAEGEAVA